MNLTAKDLLSVFCDIFIGCAERKKENFPNVKGFRQWNQALIETLEFCPTEHEEKRSLNLVLGRSALRPALTSGGKVEEAINIGSSETFFRKHDHFVQIDKWIRKLFKYNKASVALRFLIWQINQLNFLIFSETYFSVFARCLEIFRQSISLGPS